MRLNYAQCLAFNLEDLAEFSSSSGLGEFGQNVTRIGANYKFLKEITTYDVRGITDPGLLSAVSTDDKLRCIEARLVTYIYFIV